MSKSKPNILHIKHSIQNISEAELLQRCLGEDRNAQWILFNRYAPAMLGICNRYANNAQEAEDMMQEGFVCVFNKLGQFRGEASLKTWITRIMINTSINYLKRHHKVKWDHDMDEVANDLEYSNEQLLSYDVKVVMTCMQNMPDGYRMVINLFAIEGYSHKEIAHMLGIKEATSRSQYAKAKAYLQKQLVKNGIVYKAQ
jgi:RNA polymerase sigma-70 factor (ECF subfamily)